ncbi:histone-like nucleoid-structuring protein Lsr2 [Corynebacterium alimapuense]|uniref:Lsr2 family protein n=1 Tax=Corynebacterium alimapuense TaxID=1576874 RepID=A0A3M8KCC1_9CORY|nr:Lsr2 family protein [Corynebacterium alimapuense]RNE50038.1 Lsr2 family protein [Corynebacterium alimapuense]
MARREITQYFDDLDNSPLTNEQVNTIRFSVDGSHYIIDLSEENAARFREILTPYVENASALPAPRKTTSRGASKAKSSNSRKIREWAQENNLKVAERGTIPSHIVEAYNQAVSA